MSSAAMFAVRFAAGAVEAFNSSQITDLIEALVTDHILPYFVHVRLRDTDTRLASRCPHRAAKLLILEL